MGANKANMTVIQVFKDSVCLKYYYTYNMSMIKIKQFHLSELCFIQSFGCGSNNHNHFTTNQIHHRQEQSSKS